MSDDWITLEDGSQYLTVASRIKAFREKYPIELGWGIVTRSIMTTTEQKERQYLVKAKIRDPQGNVVATGIASEVVGSTEINMTSALENAETSAIGRALAACGFLGSDYASGDEIANARAQVDTINVTTEEFADKLLTAAEKDDWATLHNLQRQRDFPEAWDTLTSFAKGRLNKSIDQRSKIRQEIQTLALHNDFQEITQIANELTDDEIQVMKDVCHDDLKDIIEEHLKREES